MDVVVKVVSDAGLTVTKCVIEAQNSERKVLMELIKSSLNDHILAEIEWKFIVNQLTHERAVWHFPKSYPRSVILCFFIFALDKYNFLFSDMYI